jgi:hypothetical protein
MIKLKVNGKDRQFDGDPEMSLLWFLRDEIDLKGTKFGCGMGLCGYKTMREPADRMRHFNYPGQPGVEAAGMDFGEVDAIGGSAALGWAMSSTHYRPFLSMEVLARGSPSPCHCAVPAPLSHQIKSDRLYVRSSSQPFLLVFEMCIIVWHFQ